MPRRARFSWQHHPPRHCATCTRTCCHPSLCLLLLRLSPVPMPSPLSCPSSTVQRSSGTGWPPSLACVHSRARTYGSSQRSRRTLPTVCRSLSSHPLLPLPTSTRHPSRRTPTLSARGFASTCNSAQSPTSPRTQLSRRRACVSSPCMSSLRLARSRAWSSTCRATSTTICSMSTSATAPWTTPSKRLSPAAGMESWTCPIASCPSPYTPLCASTSAFDSKVSSTSSPRCPLV